MRRRDDAKDPGPPPQECLAASAYAVWSGTLGGTGPRWEKLSPRLQAAWERVAEQVAFWANEGAAGSAAEMAGQLFRLWHHEIRSGQALPLRFEELAARVRGAWIAVLQHLAYLLSTADPADDLGVLEVRCVEAARRLLQYA